MSNFEFLKNEWYELYEMVKQSEEIVYSMPDIACINNRKVLEIAVKWMYENDEDLVIPRYDDTLNTLLHDVTFLNTIPQQLESKVNLVKKLGNIAVHSNKKISSQDAVNSTSELFHFLYWLYRTYSESEPDMALKFDINKVPKISQDKAEVERLKQIIQQREDKDNQQKQELEKQRDDLLEEIKRIKEQNSKIKIDYDYNEQDTRKYYIDVLLKEVGWDITKPDATEYEVQGMPKTHDNPTGVGKVDYVLWGDDGKPLGVVEAKRTMVDARIGKDQAKLYADCLEAKFGQRPIIFYSNGYQHYIWDDMNYIPRRVSGFYSKDDLERLINRRDIIKPLTNLDINKDIAGRPYQERCIKSVCENFNKKNRKSLLVMATGTGKTRVAISISDILTRYNWAKRILFLADRTALVSQAKDKFKQILPEFNPVDITKSNDGLEHRVVLSTYHTMMNLIDAKKADEKIYSVGYFDLIIVDEAHRSIYKKFGEIFNYFDSLMLGLTATPRAEVDKNTYEIFELQDGIPTDYYEYDEAIKEGYLVPYENYNISTKFLREGIKYKELSEDEKEEYETKFYDDETDTLPEEIDKNQLNRWLFNEDTVDQILECLMTNGIKVNGGDKLGKTIIFAQNEDHAQFILERFNKRFKQYNGHFAQVITHRTPRADNAIKEFEVKDKDPVIAISVDKLDTGIDVIEVVNLVFFKIVRSHTKFIQMIGRGTRLCADLFGPGDDKKKFYIFDACGNFEYFDTNPPEASGSQMSLKQKIFLKRLELAEQIKNDEEVLRMLSNKIKDELQITVKTMDRENFIVRRYLEHVDRYSERDIWDNLNDLDFNTISKVVSGLPTTNDDMDELAKRFDLIILNAQLAFYARNMVAFEENQNRIRQIANDLERKASVPLVKKQLDLILEIQRLEYWDTVTITSLEEIRLRLRDLIKFLDFKKQEIVYTHFEDELEVEKLPQTEIKMSGVDLDQYRKKVTAFLLEHQNEIALNKLKFNKPLTQTDIEQLEKILKENSDTVGTKEKFKILQGDLGLGEFIRSIIGLEPSAIEEVFANYLDENNFNATQIRFIKMIISNLSQNGTMLDVGKLYEQPFTFINAEGIDGVFSSNDTDKIIHLIEEINKNARLYK